MDELLKILARHPDWICEVKYERKPLESYIFHLRKNIATLDGGQTTHRTRMISLREMDYYSLGRSASIRQTLLFLEEGFEGQLQTILRDLKEKGKL